MATRDDIITVLQTIPDPEIGVSIWDLGLVYNVEIDDAGATNILMTLTSLGCPLFPEIESNMRQKIGVLPDVSKLTIDLTFEPPWSPDKMSEEAKAQLGFL